MKLHRLKFLHNQILEKSETYGIFQFSKNGIEFDIFYDVLKMPFQLGLLVLRNDFNLWIDVDNDFNINPILNKDDYKRLADLLGLKYDPDNKFSTYSFFQEFDKRIPDTFPNIDRKARNKIILASHQLEESNNIYYVGLIEWDKIRSKRKRTPENLEKTRLLYPKLYLRIKDKNISVRYSSSKEDELPID